MLIDTLTIERAAGSLVTDPSDSSKRVSALMNEVAESQTKASELAKILKKLHSFKNRSLVTVIERAQRSARSTNEADARAAQILIGLTRTILTNRLVQGDELSDEESSVYKKLSIERWRGSE